MPQSVPPSTVHTPATLRPTTLAALRTVAAARRSASRLLQPRTYAVFFLYAERARYPLAHTAVDIIMRGFRQDSIHLFKIDNFAPEPYVRRDSNIISLSGDNSAWEFSGWARALDVARDLGISPDVFIFLNDAFLKGCAGWRGIARHQSRLNPFTLSQLDSGLAGHVDSHREDERICGLPCQAWVRTNSFACTKDVLAAATFPPIPNAVFDDWSPVNWNGQILYPHAPVSPALQSFLRHWLTEQWDRSAPITELNWPFFRKKLQAILNERLLSARYQASGVRLLHFGSPRRPGLYARLIESPPSRSL